MLRRIRWLGVGAGIMATCVVFWLLFIVAGVPLFPDLYPEGAVPTGLAWHVHVISTTLPPLASLLLTFFSGGLLAGVVVSSFPGLNGALSAAATASGGFAFLWGPAILSVIPWLWEPVTNPGEAYTRAEALGDLLALCVIFSAVLPFVVLAGYVGGRLGAGLRSRIIRSAL